MRSVRTLWAVTATIGLLTAGMITHLGYEADRNQTSGAPGPLESAMVLVFLLALVAAVVATVRARKTNRLPELLLSKVELLVVLVGLVASVVFLPAALLVAGVVGRALWRTLRPVPHPA